MEKLTLNAREAAAVLGISTSTLYRLLAQGKGAPQVRITPDRVVFLRADLQKWLEGKREG